MNSFLFYFSFQSDVIYYQNTMEIIERNHTIHNKEPLVETYEDILTPEECQHFINISQKSFKRALVSNDDKGVLSNGRSGYNTWVEHNHDEITKNVGERIAKIVGLPLENAEAYQIIYYDVSQEYRQHYDSWLHDGSVKTLRCMKYGGARIKTALCYLNDVELGGGTKMTKLDITIKAKKGKLLVFQNTQSNENHNRHPLSEHAGLPVVNGEKYAFNLWFKECNSKRLYKDFNPDYYTRNKFSLQFDLNKISKHFEIYNSSLFIDNDTCNKILTKNNFDEIKNKNIRKDAWIDIRSLPELNKKLELLFGVKSDYFENINVVEYVPGVLHNKHFVAYDLNSDKGKKYTSKLGQRLYTVTLALSDEIVINFPKCNTRIQMDKGDILVYNNVQPENSNRNPDLERTIINNHSTNGYIANIYIREKTKNGDFFFKINKKITEIENYTDTLNTVFDMFNNNKIEQIWSGYRSFTYNFKGNFDKFKLNIQLYNSIRTNRCCLNSDNLDIDYNLDTKLPIQIVENVIDKQLLSLLKNYYKDTIDCNTWELGDRQSNRYKSHNEPMSRFLHYELLPLIEKIVDKSLKPTYSYLSAYVKGAELPPHTDRKDCEYTVSFVIDKPEGANWNIYVHKPQQSIKYKGRYNEKPPLIECEYVDCEAGGLMLFQGTDHIHFREKLEYDYYNILLLHYCSV